jgi:hypothetical protein
MNDVDHLIVKHGPQSVINIDTSNDESANMLDLNDIVVDPDIITERNAMKKTTTQPDKVSFK